MRPFDDRVVREALAGGGTRDTVPTVLPTFWCNDTKAGYLSGVDNLPAALTIPGNGNTVLPTFRYKLGDADATDLDAWTYGETLTAAGSGGTYNAGSPFHGTSDDSYNPDGTRHYQASGGSFADITTEDLVIEGVIRYSSQASARILDKRSTEGYIVYSASGAICIYIFGADASKWAITAVQTDGVWLHFIGFMDMSGSGQIYVNGIADGAAKDISGTGSLTSAGKLTVAATEVGSDDYNSNIAYLAMWKGDNLLDSHLQAALAQERFQRHCGLWQRRAVGTKAWTVFTRATTAVVDNVEYGAELLPSTDPTSGWSAVRASVALDATVSHPEGATVWALSEDDTAADSHFLFESGTSCTAGLYYEGSLDVKAANRNWVMIYSTIRFAANNSSFDVSNGTAGTSTASLSNIEPLGDGWYRCRYRNIATSTGSSNFAVAIAEADNDITFTGLDQISLYIANPTMRTWQSKLYTVGAGMPRVSYRQEATSGADFKGYLPETAATNLITYSHEFDNAAWTKTRATVTANSVVAPNGATEGDTLAEDGTAANNHKTNIVWTQAAGTAYVYSVYTKAANRDWAYLRFWSATDGVAGAYFDLSTGSVGTESGNDSAGIEPVGNGWFRCWIRDTRATAEAVQVEVFIATGDTNVTFDGLSQDSLYTWQAQVEADVDYPTSYIATSGATATRNADVLYMKGDDGSVVNNQQGTMEAETLVPNVGTAVAGYVAVLTDGGSANDRIPIYYGTADTYTVLTRASGGDDGAVTATTDVTDGDAHIARATWAEDSLKMYTDGTAEGATDTTCDMPDDLDRVHIGTNRSGTGQPNAPIRNIKIWPYPTTKKGTT